MKISKIAISALFIMIAWVLFFSVHFIVDPREISREEVAQLNLNPQDSSNQNLTFFQATRLMVSKNNPQASEFSTYRFSFVERTLAYLCMAPFSLFFLGLALNQFEIFQTKPPFFSRTMLGGIAIGLAWGFLWSVPSMAFVLALLFRF